MIVLKFSWLLCLEQSAVTNIHGYMEKRILSAVGDSIHDVLTQLCNGILSPSNCESSKPQKATVTHFQRGYEKLFLKLEKRTDCLYSEGEKLLRNSEIKNF